MVYVWEGLEACSLRGDSYEGDAVVHSQKQEDLVSRRECI